MAEEVPEAADEGVEEPDFQPPRTARLRIQHTYECRDLSRYVSKAAFEAVAGEGVEKTHRREHLYVMTARDPGHPVLAVVVVAAEMLVVGPAGRRRLVEYNHRREDLPAQP